MRNANWVDFKEIRERVTIVDALSFLGIDNLRRQGNKLIGPCPVHGGSNNRAFHVDTKKNVWFCFTECHRGGNQLDLVSAVRDVSIREAALALKHHFAVDRSPDRSGSNADETSAASTIPTRDAGLASVEGRTYVIEEHRSNPVLTISLPVASDHPHILDHRGLRQATAEHFGIGYCSRGILRGTIAIPIHNPNGELVAYAGRRLKPQQIAEHGKYRFPKGFARDLELYNFHRAQASVEEHGFVILVEGFFAVMRLYEWGHPNAVASMGARLSSAQSQLLSVVPEVIVIFDGDDAGRQGSAKANELLVQVGATSRVGVLPNGRSPDEVEPRALRWLINGMRALDLSRVVMTRSEGER